MRELQTLGVEQQPLSRMPVQPIPNNGRTKTEWVRGVGAKLVCSPREREERDASPLGGSVEDSPVRQGRLPLS